MIYDYNNIKVLAHYGTGAIFFNSSCLPYMLMTAIGNLSPCTVTPTGRYYFSNGRVARMSSAKSVS